MRLVVSSLIGAALVLSAGAGSSAPQPGPAAAAAPDHGVNTTATSRKNVEGGCFRSTQIDAHTMVDDHTMYLAVRTRGVYRITFNAACLAGAVSSDTIIIRHVSGNNLVCRPMDLDISVAKGGFPTPCIVHDIALMTPAEVAAIPPKLKP